MSAPRGRFPFPTTHNAAHAATHGRWVDVVVMQDGQMFGRFVTEACCDERLAEKLAAAASLEVALVSRAAQPDGITFDATVDGKPAQLVMRELPKAPSPEWRERWARSTPEGRRPFRVTGRRGLSRAVGRAVRGPSNYVDRRAINLLLDTNRTLYAMINAARAVDQSFPDDRHAVNEMVLGMAVLTASEADALATLRLL